MQRSKPWVFPAAFTAVSLVAAPTPIPAQVYKSIDAAGNVIYSSSPPPSADPARVETVRIDPGPSEEDVAAAQRRLQSAAPSGGTGGSSGISAAGQGAQPAGGGGTAPASSPKPEPIDEAVLRAGQTNRVQRGSGGRGNENRGRDGGALPSGRMAR